MIKLVDIEPFEQFISESFPEGVTSRELRLSMDEAGYLKKKFPNAVLEEFSPGHYADGKVWFHVRL
jgi:hypothetical protein